MVVFVSHKDGSGPTAIQQWGGITEVGEIFKMAAHPETMAFVQTCQQTFLTVYPPATTVARKIKDNPFKNEAVYGNAYGAVHQVFRMLMYFFGGAYG